MCVFVQPQMMCDSEVDEVKETPSQLRSSRRRPQSISPNYHQRCCTCRLYDPRCSCDSSGISWQTSYGTIPAGQAFADTRQSPRAAQAQCRAWELLGSVDHRMLRSRLELVLHSCPRMVLIPCLGDGDGHDHGDVPSAGRSQVDEEGGKHLEACKVASIIYHHDGGDGGHDLVPDLSAPRDTKPSCRRRGGTEPPPWNEPCRNFCREGID